MPREHVSRLRGRLFDAEIRTDEPLDTTAVIHVAIAANPDLVNKAGQQPKLDRVSFEYNEHLETWIEKR